MIEEHTAIVDVFVGCDDMGVASAEQDCLCLEFEESIFKHHIHSFEDISVTPLSPSIVPTLSDDTN